MIVITIIIVNTLYYIPNYDHYTFFFVFMMNAQLINFYAYNAALKCVSVTDYKWFNNNKNDTKNGIITKCVKSSTFLECAKRRKDKICAC